MMYGACWAWNSNPSGPGSAKSTWQHRFCGYMNRELEHPLLKWWFPLGNHLDMVPLMWTKNIQYINGGFNVEEKTSINGGFKGTIIYQ